MCWFLDCELFSSKGSLLALTLIFGREWNYKNFSKSFLQFFLWPNTRYLDTYSTRESWPTDTLFLSWRKWKYTFCDQTMCWFLDCELFSFGHRLHITRADIDRTTSQITLLIHHQLVTLSKVHQPYHQLMTPNIGVKMLHLTNPHMVTLTTRGHPWSTVVTRGKHS